MTAGAKFYQKCCSCGRGNNVFSTNVFSFSAFLKCCSHSRRNNIFGKMLLLRPWEQHFLKQQVTGDPLLPWVIGDFLLILLALLSLLALLCSLCFALLSLLCFALLCSARLALPCSALLCLLRCALLCNQNQ